MPNVNVNHTLIKELQIATTTRCAGMDIVSGNAYIIFRQPDDSTNHAVKLVKVTNVEASTHSTATHILTTSSGSTAVAMHANSLTYGNGKFYMATLNSSGSRILSFDSSGNIIDHITHTSSVSAVGYYGMVSGTAKFIIEHLSSGTYYYYLCDFSNSAVSNTSLFCTIPQPSGYKGNGFYYDRNAGHIHKILFYDESPIRKNKIIEYSISSGVCSEVRTLIDDGAVSQKYEIEGMSIYNSKKYVCANINSDKAGLYKLVAE